MKHFIAFTMLILFANLSTSQNNYESFWQQVKKQEKEGLTKSALQTVSQIEKKAKAENNKPQIIKSLFFKSKYALTLEEDAQLNIINAFKEEVKVSQAPTKNVLESVLAQLYWQYFQDNRWKFYNRTKTETKVDTTDFRTWDLETLYAEIQLHFENSLQNGLILQQTPVSKFDTILHKEEGSVTYRPTLFDFLAHNALAFYESDESAITQPAYKFSIDNADYFSDETAFLKLHINSKHSTSLKLHALKIYQGLIAFHLKDKSPKALAAVNIERINFVKNASTLNNKNQLAISALKKAKNAISNNEASTLYDYEIAQTLEQQSTNYNTENINDNNRWKLKDALELCNNAIKKFPKSFGAKKCEALKSRILQPSIIISTEKYLPVQKEAKLLINYKNINALNFSVYKLSEKKYYQLNQIHRKEEKLNFIESLKNTVTTWNSTLKNEKDYQNHSTEVLLPKLENGYFLIFAKQNNLKSSFAYTVVQVTDFSLIETKKSTENNYQIINRLNGTPIANATVKATYQKNYRGSYSSKNYTTNSLGEFSIKKGDFNSSNLKLQVTKNDQTAYFGNYYVNRFYNDNQYQNEDKTHYKSFLFTDRSIYRPGQTVYFKGIAIKNNSEKSDVAAKLNVEVKLSDVNGQEVTKLQLKTNDYGSFNGEFIIPKNGLTGVYNIETTSKQVRLHGYDAISVEEYKRPKFEATFNPITNTHRVNDNVTIKGKATAYAGSTITNAKVVYRVYREVQYPIWCYWRPSYNSEPQEITFGETKTDNKGEFSFAFKALPDLSVDKNNQPIFNYKVTAEVTDINGETRTATTIVNVGYHTLTAELSIDNQLNKNNKDYKLLINTQNLNGEFVPAKGTIRVYKLTAPKHVLRPRTWKAPEYKTWDKKAFKQLFPYEAYDNESDSNTWKKGEIVFSERFNTEKTKTLNLGSLKKWSSGLYKIELETTDKYGQKVKEELKTTVFSEKDKTLADNQLFSITTDKKSYTIGETAKVTFASAAKALTVTYAIEKEGKLSENKIITLSNNKQFIKIPITKNDLGGFVVHYSYAFKNSCKTASIAISVPYPKTDLEIETVTFRDKLQPNQEETWRFKIKGAKGDKVSSELLASMYDMSLDQFKPHNWQFNPINNPVYYSRIHKNSGRTFRVDNFKVYQNNAYISTPSQHYDQLNWFGLNLNNNRVVVRGYGTMKKMSAPVAEMAMVDEDLEVEESAKSENDAVQTSARKKKNSGSNDKKEDNNSTLNGIQIRKNLQETAFFFPKLETDKDGNVSFSFTTPEALTKWKVQLLAHTKTLESTVTALETVTQKELMVTPNAPRFLRQGDVIIISSKIANISNKNLSGVAQLELFDALTGKTINNQLGNTENTKSFNVNKKENTQVSWRLTIPNDIDAIQYKVIAKAGDFSDGEQNALPVLSNRMLVTETLPMWVKSNDTRTFVLDKLKTNSSTTLKHHKLTLEMTSNPAWYAVQALPYLMEYPSDCNEQNFSRYYANALASYIANSNPRIQEVFNQWKSQDALLSNLEKNEELKSILIQETPWLRDAQNETEQKKRIALLFDLNKMKNESQLTLNKLQQNQMGNGAWAWFNGGKPNRFITQHIITGFGHLNKLNVTTTGASAMIAKAINYLDNEFIKEYDNIRKYNANVDLSQDHLSHSQLHYLYMRSFFPEISKSKKVKEITNYYHSQIKNYWLKRSLYSKGLMTLICYRLNDTKTANKILKSLEENSITSEELGMYWKENTASWFWYQAPIETQALLIEAFAEVKNDTKTIDNLKIWLLKNKQTNKWETTKATTDAVYALLLQGSDWLSITDMVAITIGNKAIDPAKLKDTKVEAGTGYFKTSWTGSEVTPKLAEVKVSKKGKGIAWGGLYWQYFEDLDKITSAKTPLQLKKKLFKRDYTDTGEKLSEITASSQLNVGDLVRVRIELRSDRDMEFVHMKDMRASGLEPVNVLSEYKWQDGLGYYESTKDASTNFFFDYLPKGIYVFEYDLRVNNAGDFSNGITTAQCMYAPEFTSHSEGVRVKVNSK